MRTRTLALIFLVVALAMGGLAAAAVDAGGQAPAGATVVPVGRIGDQGAYTRFERSTGSATWEPKEVQTFHVSALRAEYDETGHDRSTVLLSWGPTTEHPAASAVSIDLSSRDTIRRDQLYNPTVYGDTFVSDYGPHVDPSWMRTPFSDGGLLRMQGRSFEAGQDLSEEWQSGFELDWGLGGMDAQLHVFRAVVGGAVIVDGHPAVAIRMEGELEFRVPSDRLWLNGGVSFLSFLAPGQGGVAFQRSLWVTSDVPYPLVIQDEMRIGGKRFESLRSLSGFQPGLAPIPWETRPVDARPALSFERTGEAQVYPGDGATKAFCYPLSSALSDVAADSTRVDFAGWKREHPDHFLVGAQGGCRDATAGSWQLLYAAASGDGWLLRVSNAPGSEPTGAALDAAVTGFSRANAEGAWSLPPFEPDALPRRLVTIGSVLQAWEATAPKEYRERGANYVNWGVRPMTTAAGFERIPLDAYSGLDWISVGNARGEPLPCTCFPGAVTNWSKLSINATSAILGESLVGYGHWNHPVLRRANDVAAQQAPLIRPTPSQAPSQTAPRIVTGAVVAGTLFAMLTAAYYLPWLKSVGPTLLAYLPGYAKLKRNALLDHKTREQLLQQITADPGVSPPELQKNSTLGWSTLVYHLTVLEKNQLISSLIDGRHKRLFPVDSIDWRRRPAIAALRYSKAKQLYTLVSQAPGITQKELVDHLGISHTGSLWHLDRLQKVGLLQREKRGHKVHYFPIEPRAPEARSASGAAMEVA